MDDEPIPSTSANINTTNNSDYQNEFYNTGRIGRRNALPDILGCNLCTTTADLPERLSALTTNDKDDNGFISGPIASRSSDTSFINPTRDQPSTSQQPCSQTSSTSAGTSNNLMNNT